MLHLKEISNYFYWDKNTHSWKKYIGLGLFFEDKHILLVPKNIIIPNYKFSAQQYFKSVILKKKQEDRKEEWKKKDIEGTPTKKDLEKEIKKASETYLDISITESYKNHNLLGNYHNDIKKSYAKNVMTDSAINERVYNRK